MESYHGPSDHTITSHQVSDQHSMHLGHIFTVRNQWTTQSFRTIVSHSIEDNGLSGSLSGSWL